MKNSMKYVCRALALALVVLLAFGAVACSSGGKSEKNTDAELVVGSWQASINIAPVIQQGFRENDALGVVADAKFSDAFLKINLEMKEDGSYKVASDRDSIDSVMEIIGKDLAPVIKEEFMSKAGGLDETALLGSFGVESWEAFAKMLMELQAEEMALEDAGKYKLEDGKLSFESSDAEEGEENAAAYTVSEDELKISPEEGKGIEGIPAEYFPIVFKRVK